MARWGNEGSDKRAIALFISCFGRDRAPSSLKRRDWDRFVAQRRSGALRPPGIEKPKRVGEQIIAYDLKCLTAILNWAVVSPCDGRVLVERNPMHRLPDPRDESPGRPVLHPTTTSSCSAWLDRCTSISRSRSYLPTKPGTASVLSVSSGGATSTSMTAAFGGAPRPTKLGSSTNLRRRRRRDRT